MKEPAEGMVVGFHDKRAGHTSIGLILACKGRSKVKAKVLMSVPLTVRWIDRALIKEDIQYKGKPYPAKRFLGRVKGRCDLARQTGEPPTAKVRKAIKDARQLISQEGD